MRSRIALIAAIAASIIVCTAAVASAVTLTGGPPAKGVAHALNRVRSGADRVGHLHAERSSRGSSAAVARQVDGELEWALLRRPPTTRAASAPAPDAAPVAPPVAAPAPAPVSQAVVTVSYTDATSTTTPDWACIRDHESGDNYAENSGNGYSGAYQFLPSTWNEAVSAAGYPQYANGWAYEAPPAVQDAAALWLYNVDGWQPWSTRYVCGL